MVADTVAVNSIRELLSLNYGVLRNLVDNNQLPYHTATTVMNQINELETEVLRQLRSPATLEDQIMETIRQNPQYKETLYQLLQNS